MHVQAHKNRQRNAMAARAGMSAEMGVMRNLHKRKAGRRGTIDYNGKTAIQWSRTGRSH